MFIATVRVKSRVSATVRVRARVGLWFRVRARVRITVGLELVLG